MGEAESVFARASSGDAEIHCTQQIDPAIRRVFFRDVAEFVWPNKTAFELAARTGASLRMCRYWLSGEHPAPWSAVSVVLQEIIRRLD